jgi:uncharacterized DUF497 family protein
MEFEWHEQKARTNLKKHTVSFEEAVSCFYDDYQVAFEDPDHNEDEFREILIGHSKNGRLLLIVYTVREKTVRLISARLATKKEAKVYAQGI